MPVSCFPSFFFCLSLPLSLLCAPSRTRVSPGHGGSRPWASSGWRCCSVSLLCFLSLLQMHWPDPVVSLSFLGASLLTCMLSSVWLWLPRGGGKNQGGSHRLDSFSFLFRCDQHIQNLRHLVSKTRIKYPLILENSFLSLFISSPASAAPSLRRRPEQKRLSFQPWNPEEGVAARRAGEDPPSAPLCSHPLGCLQHTVRAGSLLSAGQGALGGPKGGGGRATPGCPDRVDAAAPLVPAVCGARLSPLCLSLLLGVAASSCASPLPWVL